jgi:uncharacterized membrane protein
MESFKDFLNTRGRAAAQKTAKTSIKYISDSQAAAREWAKMTRQKTTGYGKSVPGLLKRRFLNGLKIIIPLGIIIFLLVWILGKIDGILQPFFISLLGRKIPGLGLAAAIVIVLIIGMAVSTLLGRKVIRLIERGVLKIPVLRTVYLGIQQIIDSFSPSREQQQPFLRVVLVEFPKAGMKTIGFVTNESAGASGETLLNVFIPTAPNPTSGFLQIVKKEDVTPTSMSVDDAFKMVMSAGKLSIPYTTDNQEPG